MSPSSLIHISLKEEILLIKNNPTYSGIIKLLNFFALMLLAFWIPLDKSYLPYTIALWVTTWLFEGNFINKTKVNIKNKQQVYLLMLPVLFYLMHVISYVLSVNKHAAGFDLEVKLSFLVFPLVILSSNYLYKAHGRLVLIAFIIGNVISLLIGLGYAFSNSLELINGSYVFNHSVWSEFDGQAFYKLVGNRYSYFSYARVSAFHHPSYISMYINFGIIISYYLLKASKVLKSKIIYSGLILFFYVMIYLLSSKAGLLSLMFVLLTLMLIELKRNKNYILVLLVSFTLMFGLYKAITVTAIETSVAEFNKEIKERESFLEQESVLQTNSSDSIAIGEIQANDKLKNKNDRIIIWECALGLIKDNLILGVNTGEMKSSLVKEYMKIGYAKGVNLRYNVHNQYLESLLAGGIFMLLVLLVFLAYYFFYALSQKSILMGFFITLVTINLLFESMFDTIAGVVFIVFFYTFLLIFHKKETEY